MTIPSDHFAFIIGAMKAGTTSLFTLLAQHPAICPATIKEPEFFSQNQGHRADHIHDYQTLWPEFNPKQHQFCLEASTGYTKFPMEPAVPERIKTHGLHPRFIYIVRDPIARIESHYNFRRFDPNFDITTPATADHFINTSRYGQQLAHFQQQFPDRTHYLILDFAELKRDPVAISQRVFAFLGLAEFVPHDLSRQNTTPVVSAAELKLARSPLARLAALLPAGVKTAVKQRLNHLPPADKVRLTAEQRHQVLSQLSPELRQFGQAYDIDTSAWGLL